VKHRIAILCGPDISHRNTCATLIAAGLDVVGICEADDRSAGLPVKYVINRAKKKGLLQTGSRVAARILYLLGNWRQDRIALQKLFDGKAIAHTLQRWGGPTHRGRSFDDPDAVNWLEQLHADVFVVHSGQIIPDRVLALPRTGIVLGGHPGLTPRYRGAHSAFWAILKGHVEDVGCTAFLLDAGIDRGAIVAQDHIPAERGDSYFTLAWKGMIRIAEMQAAVLRRLDRGEPIPSEKVATPKGSYFDNPTLADYWRYRRQARRLGLR
jgi:hypothetical protein